jgi:hypothetical protein
MLARFANLANAMLGRDTIRPLDLGAFSRAPAGLYPDATAETMRPLASRGVVAIEFVQKKDNLGVHKTILHLADGRCFRLNVDFDLAQSGAEIVKGVPDAMAWVARRATAVFFGWAEKHRVALAVNADGAWSLGRRQEDAKDMLLHPEKADNLAFEYSRETMRPWLAELSRELAPNLDARLPRKERLANQKRDLASTLADSRSKSVDEQLVETFPARLLPLVRARAEQESMADELASPAAGQNPVVPNAKPRRV